MGFGEVSYIVSEEEHPASQQPGPTCEGALGDISTPVHMVSSRQVLHAKNGSRVGGAQKYFKCRGVGSFHVAR